MLLDTSGLLCYLHFDEPKHQEAVQFLDNYDGKLLTHNYVLAELVALAIARRYSAIARLRIFVRFTQ